MNAVTVAGKGQQTFFGITLEKTTVHYTRRARTMSNVRGFVIYNKDTGQKMATLPLTIPIGSTVEAYKKAGHAVTWGWEEGNNE